MPAMLPLPTLRPILWFLLPLFAAGTLPVLAADDPAAIYLQQIKPLLRDRCFTCHGALQQQAGLRLDTVAGMLQGGDSGGLFRRGEVAGSLLLARISASDPGERMPPEHEAEPLNPEQIDRIRAWINAGAPGPADEVPEADPREHWSFRPIVRPAIPATADTPSVRNPIDAFLGAYQQRTGLVPQEEASRRILLRRLFLDLVGMPPTAADIAACDADPSPLWYERTVDRLLNDPRYGERWGRHWMDIWRYSDWWGLGEQLRNSQNHIWHWRDWIVESLNEDVGYDELVRQMLAADELYPNDLGKLRGSGYLARNWYLFNRNQWMEETVEHVSKGFLGLTINCAKCHDHKYDPISHADFYRLRAFFEPYHVRMDLVPGEANPARDGIPRAFDGWPDAPTYRFVRGDEKQPDPSQVLAPGVPSILTLDSLVIEPVALPVEAWQPERREWVLAAYRSAAAEKVAAAVTKRDGVKQRVQAPAPPAGEAATPPTGDRAPENSPLHQELAVAEAAVAAAEAERNSIERRGEALQATWDSATEELQRARTEAAVRAEQQAALAAARLQLATAEQQLAAADDKKKESAEKEVAKAREAVVAAEKKIAEPLSPPLSFQPLPGALWSPTRFNSSAQDDPVVPFLARSTGRRTALARWLTDPRNPLPARVAVNHLWTRHLGAPLVPTVFDFGRNGARPTQPELLDWLAAELVEQNWSMKHLHRLIVTSAVYRRSSSMAGPANREKDPENRGWWRREPIRIESQVVRDSILALSENLDRRLGGPPVPKEEQAGSRRRSLYFFHSNNERHLFLTMFDEALVKDCYRREQSIVPQQALALTNSELVLDAITPIAARISLQAIDEDAFIRQAFVELLAIDVRAEELAASREALDAWRRLPGTTPEQARAQLIWALLNHNDFVTLR